MRMKINIMPIVTPITVAEDLCGSDGAAVAKLDVVV